MIFDWDGEWAKAFAAELAEMDERGFPRAQWQAGGRATKANPDKESEAWWNENGPKMAEEWATWREKVGWVIWEPIPGQPAIEIGVPNTIGDSMVKAYIDRIFVTPDGELVVVDLKSGSSTPKSVLQLGLYATLVEKTFGVRPSYGAYWMARKGDNLPLIPLDKYDEAYLATIYDSVKRSIGRKEFPPAGALQGECQRCSVAHACSFAQ